MSAFHPIPIANSRLWDLSRCANSRHHVYDFLFASGLATSRACSMKRPATGLSVRCFRVTISIEMRESAKSTGKTLSSTDLRRRTVDQAQYATDGLDRNSVTDVRVGSKTGNAQNKQMLSALPPLATGERTFRIGSFLPTRNSCTARPRR